MSRAMPPTVFLAFLLLAGCKDQTVEDFAVAYEQYELVHVAGAGERR